MSIWLNNVKSLYPEPDTAREKDELNTVKMGKLGSFHQPIEDNQLLTQQGIFDNKVSAAAGQVRIHSSYY